MPRLQKPEWHRAQNLMNTLKPGETGQWTRDSDVEPAAESGVTHTMLCVAKAGSGLYGDNALFCPHCVRADATNGEGYSQPGKLINHIRICPHHRGGGGAPAAAAGSSSGGGDGGEGAAETGRGARAAAGGADAHRRELQVCASPCHSPSNKIGTVPCGRRYLLGPFLLDLILMCLCLQFVCRACVRLLIRQMLLISESCRWGFFKYSHSHSNKIGTVPYRSTVPIGAIPSGPDPDVPLPPIRVQGLREAAGGADAAHQSELQVGLLQIQPLPVRPSRRE